MQHRNYPPRFRELAETFIGLKRYFVLAGLFSIAVNILMLVPIIYMLQVYDRVITSGSLPTLSMLTLLLIALLCALGGFEWVRSRILTSTSNLIETNLRRRVSDAAFKQALMQGQMSVGTMAYSDLSGLRQFMTGNGLFAFFDAPWFPIYVGIMFLFHPWFGMAAIIAGLIMLVLAWLNEKATSEKLKEANRQAGMVSSEIHSSLRNAEVIAAMGMTGNIRRRLEQLSDKVLLLQTDASKEGAFYSSITRSFRMIMQSLLLGLGAYLALQQEITPGMMIAGSLLLGRALAPIDMLVATWRGFSVARAQYERLGLLLQQTPPELDTMSLPAPQGMLDVDNVVVIPPGATSPVVKRVSLHLKPGEVLGIVGPSASGKSSLARTILGIWPPYSGTVRLDKADISKWNRQELGPHIGYLPQDIELFNGSIAENIARFGPVDANQVVAAARLAGVHELVLQLPHGYDTVIGGSGGILSGGQRQRIGLARAVYGEPAFVVLDEPNSNLDDQGEKELIEAIRRIKEKGCTVVIITHRPSVLNCVDNILVMKEGQVAALGPKEDILRSLLGSAGSPRKAVG